jgi:hypothetical protein
LERDRFENYTGPGDSFTSKGYKEYKPLKIDPFDD